SVSPARAAAFDILLRVEKQDSYASDLLHTVQYSGLSSADHALATELVMGVLRWRSALDSEISAISRESLQKLDVEVSTALRMGLYQLRKLERIPARAAIHESVELVKRARKRSGASFVNAVLRRLLRVDSATRSEPTDPVQRAALEWSHPAWLVQKWAESFGMERTRQICAYDQQVPATVVRLQDAAARALLADEGVRLAPGSLLSSAWRVESGNVTKTRAFREGRVAIQDEASQLVALLLGQVEKSAARILDCCAAPGGKTAIVAERNPGAQVFALDLHSRRAQRMRKAVRSKNVHMIVADANHLPFAC